MAKTSAERQAAYRAKMSSSDSSRRINTWIESDAHTALDRLARHCNFTKKELLERLIVSAESVILKTLKPNSKEWRTYMHSKKTTQ